MVTCADPEGGRGFAPLLENQKFYGFLELAFGPPAPAPPPGIDVHKTKQKSDRNRATTSLVLDSSIQRGRWEFRLNQRIWLRLSSVFESRRISVLKIFFVWYIAVLIFNS